MDAPHRSGVEQDIDQVIVQKVHLVHVQHTAMSGGQQSRLERTFAVSQHLLQIERTDHAILGRADWKLYQSGWSALAIVFDVRKQRRECAYDSGLRGPLLAADEDTTDSRVHRTQDQ